MYESEALKTGLNERIDVKGMERKWNCTEGYALFFTFCSTAQTINCSGVESVILDLGVKGCELEWSVRWRIMKDR